MKICPVCVKTYDDSWKVCLNCEVNLKDIAQKEQIEQDIMGRALNSVLYCSVCKKEYKQDSMTKLTINWNKYGHEVLHLCPDCRIKQNSLFNRLFNNPATIPPFLPFLMWSIMGIVAIGWCFVIFNFVASRIH